VKTTISAVAQWRTKLDGWSAPAFKVTLERLSCRSAEVSTRGLVL
jgi:hypothetical protein